MLSHPAASKPGIKLERNPTHKHTALSSPVLHLMTPPSNLKGTFLYQCVKVCTSILSSGSVHPVTARMVPPPRFFRCHHSPTMAGKHFHFYSFCKYRISVSSQHQLKYEKEWQLSNPKNCGSVRELRFFMTTWVFLFLWSVFTAVQASDQQFHLIAYEQMHQSWTKEEGCCKSYRADYSLSA